MNTRSFGGNVTLGTSAIIGPGSHLLQTLLNDLDAFTHFLNPNPIPIVCVTIFPDRHAEFTFRVGSYRVHISGDHNPRRIHVRSGRSIQSSKHLRRKSLPRLVSEPARCGFFPKTRHIHQSWVGSSPEISGAFSVNEGVKSRSTPPMRYQLVVSLAPHSSSNQSSRISRSRKV